MARYIDADALLENLKKQYGEELGWQCTVNMSDVGMMIEDAPAAEVVPKSEVEQWYHEYHAIRDELKQEKMYHRETEKLADRYCAELQTAKSEVERLEKALADKARECNMAVDKICLEHREEIRALKEKHEAELAEAKREVSNEIFAGVKLLLQNMVDKYGYKATLEPDFDQKKEYRGAQIGVSVALHSVVAYEYEVKKKYKENQT